LSIDDRQKINPSDACASCHMPKRTVTTITHAALTEHRILTRPDEPYPQEAFEPGESSAPGLLHLTAGPGSHTTNTSAITLFQAYAGLVHDGHSEFKTQANEMLDRLAHEAPGSPVVLSALARRAVGAGSPEAMDKAMRDFAGAIQAGASAEDYLLLAGLHGKKKQNAEAIAVLQKGLRANPYVREFPESLAVEYMALGQYREASEVIRKGLDLFPDDVALRVLQKKVRAATLEGSIMP
jgi:tetratricopeptide repeat protein